MLGIPEEDIPSEYLHLVNIRKFLNIKYRKDFKRLSHKDLFTHWYLSDKLQVFIEKYGDKIYLTGSWYLGHWRHPNFKQCEDKCTLAKKIGKSTISDLDFWVNIDEKQEEGFRQEMKDIGKQIDVKSDYVNWTGPGINLVTGEVRMCNPRNLKLPPLDTITYKYISVY